MVAKRCLDCTAIVAVGLRCPLCRRKYDAEHRETQARRNGLRSSSGWARNRQRQRILDRDGYICQACGGFATEVDHVVPLFKGGADDDTNLRALCERCHAAKTARERVRVR